MRILQSSGRSPGFTLIELLVVLAVLAILVTIAIPSFQNIIRDNRVTAQSNELTALISYARSQASQGASRIRLTIDRAGNSWSLIIEDLDCSPSPPCILRAADNRNVLMDSNDAPFPIQMQFNSRGILATGQLGLSLQHDPCSGPRQRRELDVLVSGNVRSRHAGCQGG